MVKAITDALAASPATVVSVTTDGQTTQWDRARAISELTYWRRRLVAAARAASATGRTFRGPDLSGARR